VAPDDLVQAPESHRCEDSSHFLREQREVGNHLFGRALELGPKVRPLGCDSGGAAVQVALARHGTADRNQRRRTEAEGFGA